MMLSNTEKERQETRTINDRLRRQFPLLPSPHYGIQSHAVSILREQDPDNFWILVNKVRTFEDFNEDNDPYGEHDFGRIKHNGTDYFFKIDYGSVDFAPDIVVRAITLMEAREY